MAELKVMVLGAQGQVGAELINLCQHQRSWLVRGYNENEVDITKTRAVKKVIKGFRPDYLVNAVTFRGSERGADVDRCSAVNRDGVKHLAQVCHSFNIPLLHLSSHDVFAGTGKAYRESDLPAPNSIYGQSLWEGEEALRHAQPQHIILRPSWLFGSLGNSFLETVLRQAKFDLAGLRQDLSDEPGHPTPALDVAKVLLAIIQQLDCQAEVWGTYHYCGAELTTWREFIDTIIAEAKIHHICQFINGASGPVAYRAGSAQPSILDCTRLFETFGIKQKSWRPGLVQALKALAAK